MIHLATMASALFCLAAGPAGNSPETWTYDGTTGPAHWAELNPAFAACASGHEQSPIPLDTAAKHHAGAISLSYGTSKLRLTSEHNTVVASVEPGSELVLDGKHYALIQFHVHHPSEHTLGGKHFPAEMHFVHKAADGSIAVLGVFIAEGEQNAAFAAVLHSLPAKGAYEMLGTPVNLRALVGPVDLGEAFHYRGSLTSPPCSEGVSWNIREEPITWSKEQIAKVMAAIPTDNRPLQPLGDRAVYLEP